MKIHKSAIIFLFLLILSMGVVCAEDVNQTSQDTLQTDNQGALESTNDDIIADGQEKTYVDLFDGIIKANDTITLEDNYKYNESDGDNKLLTFKNRTAFTIEGNNKIIDGNGKASLFVIQDQSNVTIKNLIIKNCVNTPLVVRNATLTTINVTFENNTQSDFGGVAKIFLSSYTSIGDKFINNNADQGSALAGITAKVNITNGLFKTDVPIRWSLIYMDYCDLNIYETIFANTTSRYATAIHSSYKTTIQKSKFINLHANATAGAIAIKTSEPAFRHETLIIGCEFINVTAAKNGGAIFADANADVSQMFYRGALQVHDSTFKNCNAEFGGAILGLGGTIELHNSSFINNSAAQNGGAVYASNATVYSIANNFENNIAERSNSMGGALYLDFGTFSIEQTTFKNNVAEDAGAIYSFNNKYIIKDSTFENNGQDIHTCFDDKGSSIKNCGEYTSNINDMTFNITLRYNGNEIVLNRQKINGSIDDAYFNLRDLGLVTPVKNQGSMGSCWAFGAAGAFESAFLIATNITLDISENNIQNLGLRYSLYGNPRFPEGGTALTSTSYFMSWLGAVDMDYDEYDELGKISSVMYGPNAYHAVDAAFIEVKDQKAVKEALLTYGALDFFVYGANSQDPQYYNNKTNAVYYYGNKSGNHYVTLVGWDDNFAATNFVKEAPGPGAWICKNSWGTEWGDEGYFYISYYDKALSGIAVGYIFDNTEYYEKLYQNEMCGIDDFMDTYTAYTQVFKSEDRDIIAAVGSYFMDANTPYVVGIYVNEVLVYSQNGLVDHAGYNTIKLDKYVAVDRNTTFEVRIASKAAPILYNTRFPIFEGVNFAYYNGKFIDLGARSEIAPIKAYTFHNPIISENIVKYYDTKNTIFTVHDVEGDSLTVTWKNKNHTISIVNGSGSLNLGVLSKGDYNVTVYYRNMTYINQVLVKTTIDTDDTYSVTVAYNTELTFKAQFLDSNGKPLKNTKITVKFDGKTLTGKTDAKGMFPFVIEKGYKIGSYKINFKNPKTSESANVAIKIVSRFTGTKNIKMYYYDGTSYKVGVRGNNGKLVGKNKIVVFKIGKKAFKVKTNAKGYAILKIPYTIKPGRYAITTTYAGQTVKKQLVVYQVLKTSKKVAVKKSAKKLTLTATLKKGKTPLYKKVVRFTVNGKTYKAVTNKKGVAKYTLNKAAINKLKVKKYTIGVRYLNDIVKSTLIVRR